jgi:transposase-like protein
LLSGKIQARRTEVTKSTRAQYTLEFKIEAVRMVEGGQSLAVV